MNEKARERLLDATRSGLKQVTVTVEDVEELLEYTDDRCRELSESEDVAAERLRETDRIRDAIEEFEDAVANETEELEELANDGLSPYYVDALRQIATRLTNARNEATKARTR